MIKSPSRSSDALLRTISKTPGTDAPSQVDLTKSKTGENLHLSDFSTPFHFPPLAYHILSYHIISLPILHSFWNFTVSSYSLLCLPSHDKTVADKARHRNGGIKVSPRRPAVNGLKDQRFWGLRRHVSSAGCVWRECGGWGSGWGLECERIVSEGDGKGGECRLRLADSTVQTAGNFGCCLLISSRKP